MKLLTLILFAMALFLNACTPQPEPQAGSRCTTKILSYEEMAKTGTNRHFKGND